MSAFPWMVEVFGIPVLATENFKNSGNKLNHVASILAELLDNDNDGCADDSNVLKNIITKSEYNDYNDYNDDNEYYPTGATALRKAIVLPNEDDVSHATLEAVEKAGFLPGQYLFLYETHPQCSGLRATDACRDASMEEVLHFINNFGHEAAYPTVFGSSWYSNSLLTKAMDIAR